MRTARRDPTLRARVVSRRALPYVDGADPARDLPAHVRAASAIVHTPHGHVIIQDDTHFLAIVEPDAVRPIALPADDGVRQFHAERGNKAQKADLESACTWRWPGGSALVALGSGSRPERERLVIVRPGRSPEWLAAPSLYAALRQALPDAELNLEGAWQDPGGALVLLQRGNGGGGVDARIEVGRAWLDAALVGATPPRPTIEVVRWALGEIDGVRLGFTDGFGLDGDRWVFSGAAEASPDAYDDGPVAGSVIGWADAAGGRWAPLLDERGSPLRAKLEGIAPSGRGLVAVADPDDIEVPAELWEVELEGPWPG